MLRIKTTTILTLLALLYYTQISTAQEEKEDIKHHKVNVAATGSLNKTTSDVINVYNTNIRYGYTIENAEFNASAKWIYGSKTAGLSNNDVILSIDGNRFHKRIKKFNTWVLGSFTSSYSLNIFSQFQAGVGVAYKITFLEKERETTEKTRKHTDAISLRMSNGIIYEQSNVINAESKQELYNVFRNSLRVQLQAQAWDKVELSGTFYWQPVLNNLRDRNIILDIALGFKIANNIKFDTRLGYNYISRTAKENLTLTYGVGTSFTF